MDQTNTVSPKLSKKQNHIGNAKTATISNTTFFFFNDGYKYLEEQKFATSDTPATKNKSEGATHCILTSTLPVIQSDRFDPVVSYSSGDAQP